MRVDKQQERIAGRGIGPGRGVELVAEAELPMKDHDGWGLQR
jgi:hypothetical protein